MWDEEYWHLENLMNLGAIGRQNGLPAAACCPSSGAGRRPRRCARSRSSRTERVLAPLERRARAGTSPARAARARRWRAWPASGLPVPPGFVVLAERALDGARRRGRARRAARARCADAGARPGDRRRARRRPSSPSAYAALGAGDPPWPCARPPCAEDSDEASFAGQQETYLGVPRRGARRRERVRRLLGLVLQRARALLPRAEGLARRPRAWRSSCSAWSRPTSRASSSPSIRSRAAATGWSSRRCSASASRPCRASVTPDNYMIKRDGRSSARASRTPRASALIGGDGGRALSPEDGARETLDGRRAAPPGRARLHARGAQRRARRTSSGRSRAASSTCCSRAR